MSKGILWLAVTPTSYNNFLWDSVWERCPGSLKVIFAASGAPDGTWPEPNPLPSWWGGYYGRGMPNLRTIRDLLRSRAALTVVAGWDNWTRRIALLVLFLLRKRYVIWTDGGSSDPMRHSGATAKHGLRNLAVRLLAARAIGIMGAGKMAVNSLRGMGIRSGKIINFPYFVRLPNGVKAGRKSARGVRFCCVGRLVPYKNFACAIRALALIPEDPAGLDIIGSGPELATLRRVAREADVDEKVRFMGFLDSASVAGYFREEGDCLIHPAGGIEPFGVVIAEAMANGLPVIASELCGAAVDRICDGENGFLLPAPVDVKSLAERMREFVTSPEKIAIMGTAARQTAEEWPVERGLQILNRLASGLCSESGANGSIALQTGASAGRVKKGAGETSVS